MTALITAVYGNHDNLRPLPPDHGFSEAIAVTDDNDLSVSGWNTYYLPFGPDSSPRRSAKLAKCLPWAFTREMSSVWIDAAFEVRSSQFSEQCRTMIRNHDLTVVKHPDDRTDVYQEAEYCQDWPKYAHEPIRGQIKYYESCGLPRNSGLWACGVLIRQHSERQVRFGHDWLSQVWQWSLQDQLSFAFMCWKRLVAPHVWDLFLWTNEYLTWHPHNHLE